VVRQPLSVAAQAATNAADFINRHKPRISAVEYLD
jgi:hypothetical protein